MCYTLESNIDVPMSPTPPRSSPTPPRSPILMDMSDSDPLSPDLNESSLLDPTPIDIPTTVHEVQYKIMFSVHTFVRHEDSTKQVPLVTSMMSRRSKQDYITIFRGILDSLASPPQVQRVVLDYEEATWRAMRIVMSNIKVQGCAFHFTQAVYRHV
ncbi:hypothetical protein LSH36_898g00022 [Paralvinella palmiformis]|uniref:MULE transposase domain-containing protein n=1 Tax=Paralvinella palmiformis TaxID=53620 RepID=A0AAD9IYH2_9ANNE|nr:hypothetical protein LSH36_898g00022 [Paralvinella palmiformis]